MKTYTPKRLLRKAIEATQASLDGKWKLAHKNGFTWGEDCELCNFTGYNTYSDRICRVCPFSQYKNGNACSDKSTYKKWRDRPTPKNFMAVRRELQATLRWLKKQLPEKRT